MYDVVPVGRHNAVSLSALTGRDTSCLIFHDDTPTAAAEVAMTRAQAVAGVVVRARQAWGISRVG